jgi:octaprenyl-diphosphate synthase
MTATNNINPSAPVSTGMGRWVLEPLAAVTRRVGLDPLTRRLTSLRRWLRDDLKDLEEALAPNDVCNGGDDLARRAAAHLLELPGKRIRPLCVVLSARVGGRDMDQNVRNLAVACELVHAATLLHDDVLDEGTERRGVETARVVYGNSASILAGDYLLTEALKRVSATGYIGLLTDLLQTISVMVEAEAVQLAERGQFNPNPETYLEVAYGKTAALFRWGLVAGGTVSGLDEVQINALAQAGNALGLAFQLIDDVLDLEGNPVDIGKDPFADVREGKVTWPLIIACERDPSILSAMRELMENPAGEAVPAVYGPLITKIRETGALVDTRAYATEQSVKAREALSHLPSGKARKALEAVTTAAIRRKS